MAAQFHMYNFASFQDEKVSSAASTGHKSSSSKSKPVRSSYSTTKTTPHHHHGPSSRDPNRRHTKNSYPTRTTPQAPPPSSSSSSSSSSVLSPDMELRLQLLPKIAEYKSKQWITPQQEEHFMKRLSNNKVNMSNAFERDQVALQVQQELAHIKQRKLAPKNSIKQNLIAASNSFGSHASNSASTTVSTTSRQSKSDIHDRSTSRSRAKSQHHDSTSQSAPNQVKTQSKNTFTTEIVDLSSNTFTQNIPRSMVETLFVEMSFFARMGFVQPQCCLQCAYTEISQQSNIENQSPAHSNFDTKQDCTHWVIWRKEAQSNRTLRPDSMQGNLMIMTCRSAQTLIEGETVEGWKWDQDQQIMVKH